jgi:hypothetical protein
MPPKKVQGLDRSMTADSPDGPALARKKRGRDRELAHLLRRPSFGLLLALALLILLAPLADALPGGMPALAALHLSMLAFAIRLVASTRGQRTGVWLLALPTMTVLFASFYFEEPAVLLANFALLAVFYGYLIHCLFVYVFRDSFVTIDDLCAATCIYVLIAMLFACVYSIQEQLAPGSFSIPATPGSSTTANYWDLLYFSFTVLTSTGFGDIHPVARQARAFAVLEQVSGVMYVAILIARLTGMRPIRRQRERDEKRP